MLNQLVPLAVVNLLRARTRLIMTTGGVLIGTSAVILLIAFTIGLQNVAESGIGSNAALTEIHVTVRVPESATGKDNKALPELTVDSVQKLSRVQGVKVVIPVVNLQGVQIIAGEYSGYRQIIGLDPGLLPYLGIRAETGALTLGSGQAISGHETGKNFASFQTNTQDFKPVDVDLLKLPVKLQLTQFNAVTPSTRQVDIKIATQLSAGTAYDQMLIMPIRDVITLNEWVTNTKYDPKTFRFDQITVRAQSREVTSRVAKDIQKLGFNTDSMGDLLTQLNSFFTTMRLLLGGIGFVALLIAASGVANTMLMATRERIKEIGLMKAIGASDQDILTIFLLEAGLIGLAGGGGGVGLSYVLQDVINRTIRNLPNDPNAATIIPLNTSQITPNLLVIPPELAIFAIGLAILVCVVAGLYPAWWAARLSPVVALKQE